MHICYYEGVGEEWSRSLAWRMVEELDGVDSGKGVLACDEETINETSDYLLSKYIKEQKYVLIVVSQKLFTDIYELVELDIIRKLFLKGEIDVFSIYDGKHIPVLPERAEWINDTYKIPLNREADVQLAGEIIMERIMKDKLVDSMAASMVGNMGNMTVRRNACG